MASARDLTPLDIELRIRRGNGGIAWVRNAAAAHRGADGSVVWDGIVTDITHLKATESALKARSEVLRAASQVNIRIASELDGDSLMQAVLDAGRGMINAAYGAFFYYAQDEGGERLTLYRLSGASPEDFAGMPMPRGTSIFGPTLRGERIIRSDDVTSEPEYGQNPPYFGMPEGHIPVRSYLAAPVISRSGEVLGGLFFGHPDAAVFDETAEEIVSGIAAQAAVAMENARLFRAAEDEIARRRAVEERQRMLLAELNHRVKNTLAVVLAITQQTARTTESVAQFNEAFRGRIMALANAHSLLTAGEWRATTLGALIAGALAPYGEIGGRARVAGPEVVVPPKQALALGLVFHEMATNASKYGALSPRGGELRVDWYDDGDGVLALDWHESLSTTIDPPGR
jgi:two-component sensor histidine kinase